MAARRADRVLSVEMFEHVRNHEQLLRRIASWLKPAGVGHPLRADTGSVAGPVRCGASGVAAVVFDGSMLANRVHFRIRQPVILRNHIIWEQRPRELSKLSDLAPTGACRPILPNRRCKGREPDVRPMFCLGKHRVLPTTTLAERPPFSRSRSRENGRPGQVLVCGPSSRLGFSVPQAKKPVASPFRSPVYLSLPRHCTLPFSIARNSRPLATIIPSKTGGESRSICSFSSPFSLERAIRRPP